MTLPPNVSNLLLRTFDRLTVREFVETRNREAYWRCSCECGRTDYVVRGKNLIQWEKVVGRAISCGCYRADPIARKAARLKLTEAERKAAGGGKKIRETPDKPAPVKRVAKPKRDPLPVRKDYIPSKAAIAARGDAPAAVARKPLWIAICKERKGGDGYRLHIRIERGHTHYEMSGRRERAPSDVRRAATRLFGDLAWQTGDQAGLSGQPWVLEIAPVYIKHNYGDAA